MYFEAGKFDAKGRLVVKRPFATYHGYFKYYRARDELIPLTTLTTMSRSDFYRAEFQKVYSQAMMLVYYLMTKHRKAMDRVLEDLNRGKIGTNAKLLASIAKNTHLSWAQIEAAYRKQ